MSCQLFAVDAQGGQAVYREGFAWYRISVDEGWMPIQLKDELDGVRASHMGVYQHVSESPVFGSVAELVREVRRLCQGAMSIPETRFSKVAFLCPNELRRKRLRPAQRKPLERIAVAWSPAWVWALEAAYEYHPMPVYLHVAPFEVRYREKELETQVWLEVQGRQIATSQRVPVDVVEALWGDCLRYANDYCRRYFRRDSEDIAAHAVELLLSPLLPPHRPLHVPVDLPAIVRHCCRVAARHSYHRSQPPHISLDQLLGQIVDTEPGPESRAVASEQVARILTHFKPVEPFPLTSAVAFAYHERLYRAIGKLNDREKELIIDRYFRERRLGEIAKQLAISPALVARRLHEVLEKLRDLI